MKIMRVVSVAGAVLVWAVGIFFGSTFISRAQTQMQPVQASPDSIVQVIADAQSLTLLSPSQIPGFGGTFWVVSGAQPPAPWPCFPSQYDPASTPVFSLGPAGQFLVDATGGALPQPTARQALLGVSSATLVQAQMNGVLNLISQVQDAEYDSLIPGDGGTNAYFSSSYAVPDYGTSLWLEITNVGNGLAYLNLHNATNQVYAIWSATNLLTGWQVETEVWPTNQDVMPFTVPTLERQNLFLRAEDWTGVTENGNTTPDWWFWEYFGTVDLSDTDLDSTGNNTLLYDYQNGIDPNIISFSIHLTNYYVNTTNVSVQLNILGGVPAYIAVLVNDVNRADAVWQPYVSSNFVATLGATNGANTVYVSLRGLSPDATQTWQLISATLYSAAPMLTITNPTTSVISQSPIQLQGFASNPLDSLTFDVSNAAGVLTNQPGFLTGQFYDTNLLAYTTNYFECSGVVLDSGTNVITLHATDWAGNATNVSFTVIYSPDTNPPALNLVWPQDGTVISSSNFTLQAEVSDPTATVTASVNGSAVQGLVEQNGTAWVQNLLLNAGTNAVSLIASNIFGGVSVTNFNVIENDVGLVIDPLPDDQLNQPLVTVTGSINDPSDTVTVNGIQANVDTETGTWEADGVPVDPTGTASLNVQVGDSSNNPLSSGAANQPQPATVVLAGYSGSINTHNSSCSGLPWPCLDVQTINWAYDSGGDETASGYTPNDAGTAEINFSGGASLPADGPGFANPGLPFGWDYFLVSSTDGDFQRSSEAQLMIAPSGQEPAGTTNVYLVLTCASEYSNPFQDFGNSSGDLPLPPEWLQNNGQTLVNTGITNTDGAVWGASTASGLSGVPVLLKTIATQHYLYNAFSFNNRVFQLVSQCVASTPSNQARTNLGVGELVNLSFIPALPTTNIIWSATAGSLAVMSGSTNLFTAPSNAANVTVTAMIGNMPVNFCFKVLEPTNIDHAGIYSWQSYDAGVAGAFMRLKVYVAPTNVSFYRVKYREIGEDASSITGYFSDTNVFGSNPAQTLTHKPADWGALNEDNSWDPWDTCILSGDPVAHPPWDSGGSFRWVIPGQWKVSDFGATNDFPNPWYQDFTIDSSGTIRITKFDSHWIQRTTNNVITFSPGDPIP